MDARHLRQFVAVFEHENMLRASEAVHVTQPALTKSIKSLEEELRVRLFDRTPKGVVPTIYGQQLYKHARLILNQIHRAEAEIKAVGLGHLGNIRIGFSLNFLGSMVTETVFDLIKKRPGLHASIVAKPFNEILPMLRRGDLDLVVAVFPFDEPESDLVYELLIVDEFRAICRASHPLLGKAKLSMERLSKADWVLFDQPRMIVSLFRAMFFEENLPIPQPVIQTNSIYVLKYALNIGDYLSYLPPSIVYEELTSGAFVALPTEMPSTMTKAGIIYRANDILPAAATDIVEALKDRRRELEEHREQSLGGE